MHNESFFDEAIDMSTQISTDGDRRYLLISPVEAHVLEPNRRPVVGNLVARAVDHSFDFVHADEFEVLK